jgi:hypothetical protein
VPAGIAQGFIMCCPKLIRFVGFLSSKKTRYFQRKQDFNAQINKKVFVCGGLL